MNFHINIQDIQENGNNFNNNPLTIQVMTLLQILTTNRNSIFPPRLTPKRMYKELLDSRSSPTVKTTTMRGLLRFFVLIEAQVVQITNDQVISRATDMLMLTATRQEKLDYKILADQVNMLIRN